MENKFEIRFLDKEGSVCREKGVINDEPHREILRKHASEYPEPHVVYLNGKLTSF